ncbi:hypothetical protein [Acetanaerobacterium elongatum]|uniref:Uncharacterized protein n=1 Tax=Acetanaerobacterium elongatum TaxID=258515 RepID=A0A1H0CUD3_9FIRM|nr:hypothetical protein [Acetanaerobacterium elongatum]SDN61489.1 hypothetical protein SAMN05192585_12510 [Acetanaerobacterium elongatum]
MGVNKNIRVTVAGDDKKDVTIYIKKAVKAAQNNGAEQDDNLAKISELERDYRTMADRFNREQGLSLHLEGECNRLKAELERHKAIAVQKEAEAAQLLQELQETREENKALIEKAEMLEKQCAQLDALRHQLGGLITETKRKTERYAPSDSSEAQAEQPAGRKQDFFRRDINDFRKNLSELEKQIAGGFADISTFIDNAHLEIENEPSSLFEADIPELFDYNEPFYYAQPDDSANAAPVLEVEATLVESMEDSSGIQKSLQGEAGAVEALPLQPENKPIENNPAASEDKADEQQTEEEPARRLNWLNFKLRRETVRADELHSSQSLKPAEDDFVEDTLTADPLFSSPIWADEIPAGEGGFRKRFHEHRSHS